MEIIPKILIMLGLLFLLGLVTDLIGGRTPLPRVTLLLLAGFAIGPSGLDVLPGFQQDWFPVITNIALSMVGFLLGHHLTFASLKLRGTMVLGISLGAVVATAVSVFVGLIFVGVQPELALVLAGIAPATAPTATLDVIREVRAKGEFSKILENVVAIDDAWGLLLFSLLLTVAHILYGPETGWEMLILGSWEIDGALILGLLIGIPMAYVTGRIQPGEPTQAEALGFILLCGGLAIWWHVSFIFAGMVLGTTVANFARHHRRPFIAIEGIEWPFMILFFILAGASFEIDSLQSIGIIGAAYILFRLLGRVIGAWGGGLIGGANTFIRHWMGLALWPQAGVAIGMALLASQHFPELKDNILSVVIGSTIIFELIGPIMARKALVQAGEAQV